MLLSMYKIVIESLISLGVPVLVTTELNICYLCFVNVDALVGIKCILTE